MMVMTVVMMTRFDEHVDEAGDALVVAIVPVAAFLFLLLRLLLKDEKDPIRV